MVKAISRVAYATEKIPEYLMRIMPGMVTLLALFSLSLPVSVNLVTLRVVLIVIAALIISLIIR